MKDPIRILHVLGGLDRGGAETMVMNIYRNIDRTKIQFDFIIHYPEKDAYIKEIKHLGGKIFNIPNYYGINTLQYFKEWHYFFKKHPEYNIIHGHVRSTASIYLQIADKYGLTTISHSHSISNGSGIKAKVKDMLKYPIRKIADYFFAPSLEAGEWLFGKEITKRDNFFIIKNAIDIKKFSYEEKTRNIKRKELNINNETVIGHIGRFEEEKNHYFLIHMFKEYHSINPNSFLLLVGQGKLENNVKDRVSRLGLDSYVKFLGSRSDVSGLLQAMDIFILPSHYEGLGIVAIEAQTAGLPVIASNMVPKEVEITNLITFKSLEKKPLNWAQSINDALVDERKDNIEQKIILAGYDIKETARKLQNLYTSINHDKKLLSRQ